MPLNNNCTYEAIQQNISKLIKEGYDHKQAVAIAFTNAKDNGCDMKTIYAHALKKDS